MAAFAVEEIPSLEGKVFLVTGANAGIGFQMCKVLASKGATVIMAYRNPEKSRAAVEEVRKIAEQHGGKVEELLLDLGDLASVKRATEEVIAKKYQLHCLVNNAGVMRTPFGLTKDGFETQFGINHLGHFAFTGPLVPVLLETAKSTGTKSRIVNLTSNYHAKGPKEGILFDNLKWEKSKGNKYDGSKAYGHSKFANVLFTQELSYRLGKDSPILVNCVHPGFVDTELTRHIEQRTGKFLVKMVKVVNSALNVHDGALTQLYVACSPEIEKNEQRAQYFIPIAKHSELDPKAPAITQEMRTKLWTISEELTGVKFDV